jgi:predicted NodU family carbamoyl transferase
MNKDKKMKDGYYLSTYISVDKDGNVYNFFANRHDFNIALWKKSGRKVDLVKYWELERQTRLKHHMLPFFDSRQVDEFIGTLLKREGLTLDDINGIWGSPHYERSEDSGVLVPDFYCHGIAHLFSSMLIDTDIFYKETILGMALDLRADNETETRTYGANEYVGCVSRKGKLEYFNIASPALLWFIFKKECNMEEGSLMALASATKCRKVKPVMLEERMLFKTLDYELGYEIYHTIVDELSEETVVDIDHAFTLEDNLLSAAVKEVNRISQYIMRTQIVKILNDYGLDATDTYLALSGGYGLNCPNNSWVMREFGFKGFLGAPCMNDSGEALGMGLFMMYSRLGRFDFKLKHAFYGDSLDEADILQYLSERGFVLGITDIDAKTFVNDISNNVIVWVDGGAEIGPRALGHRSLLGDPRRIETKNELNRIKQRQFWRPVAPIVLEEFTKDWFEDMYVSPYMLQTSQIRKEKADFVPAIIHLDGSSRLQTLNFDTDNNKLLYAMIYAFYKHTGVPIVCNTSLNDRGEPICNRPCEALHFALKKHIKIAYINGKRVELTNFDKYNGESKFEPELSNTLSKQRKEEYICSRNPYGLSVDVIKWKSIFPDYDISTKDGAKALKRAVEMSIKQSPILERVFDEN